jgi:two-component system LytT family response regulator
MFLFEPEETASRFLPQVRVVGEAADVEEARKLNDLEVPDLLFLDIEMPGITGIEKLRQMPQIPFEVIFVTAFNRYAVEAFRLGAADYLFVNPSDLQNALERAEKNLLSQTSERPHLKNLAHHYGETFTKVTIPTLNGYEFIDFKEIVYFESDGNYTTLRLMNGKQVVATRSLASLEELLEPYRFFRVHKSYLINLAFIRKYINPSCS